MLLALNIGGGSMNEKIQSAPSLKWAKTQGFPLGLRKEGRPEDMVLTQSFTSNFWSLDLKDNKLVLF